MKYIVFSDIHGSYHKFSFILNYLENNGWEIRFDDKRPYLFHETDVLIFAGDINDRGTHSAELMYLLWGSSVGNLQKGLESSVVTLLGNHCVKVKKYFYEGWKSDHEDWGQTVTSLERNSHLIPEIKKWCYNLPLRYNGKGFRVVHAYFSDKWDLCLYGKRDNETKEREQWWLYEEMPKSTIIGHYHFEKPIVDYHKRIFSVDNWDGGYASIAEILPYQYPNLIENYTETSNGVLYSTIRNVLG